MTFLADLATKRQQLLDGIDANEGDINLRIFEDFYPDEAHFIYELLQNAEDAGASEVSFELTPQSCVFEHNGKRHFDERDIKAITGIYNSSKKDSPDKIGKFGVGFKSVFVYTETPVIYSKNFSFQIVKLVLPQAVPPKPTLGERTRFEFPFNNPKKNVEQAYAEVKTGLEQLSETTLLFLNNLHYIRWKIGEEAGAVLREQHSDFHIEVLKQLDGRDVFSSHWLRFMTPVEDLQRFTAPVDGVERQKVAVAFELAFTGEQKAFDTKAPIAKQLKIVPTAKGQVSVFFPADKETSGLRFHLHAPFIPELSRASIKNSPENMPLFEQLAKLTASSLHRIKELGLLTGEFLAVLPNNEEQLPDRYRVIRTAIVREMKTQPLTPTQARGFAPAERLVQARASIKELLSDQDLAFLLRRVDSPTWAIGATQRNSNQDRFLSSLDIVQWDVDRLVEYVCDECDTADDWSEPDPEAMNWLDRQSDEWHQWLYAILYRYCEDEDEYDRLRDTKIVRLTGGGHATAKDAYFATGSIDAKDHFRWASENVLTVGARKTRQADARTFLTRLGVRVPVEADEIRVLLQTRYGETGEAPADNAYIADLKYFIDYLGKNPHEREMFNSACLFRVDSEQYEWASADEIYLDDPFKKTGLDAYHGALKSVDQKKWPLSSWYLTCGLPISKLTIFAEAVGCETEFHALFLKTTCERNPQWRYLREVAGSRGRSPIDADCSMSQVTYDLLRSESVAFSRLVWGAMCTHGANHLQARYQKTEKDGSRFADSRLVHFLRTEEWVPLRDGRFVTPRHASQDSLLDGFVFDSGYKWLESVEFGSEERKKSTDTAIMAAKRAELGFESDEILRRAQKLARMLPPDEIARVLAEYESRHLNSEFPEKPVRNRELRGERVREQAEQTPVKQSEIRSRTVAVDYEAAKIGAKMYLREQYTNSNGVMFCQVCKAELPFKLPSGAYYFDAVEISDSLEKRFRETFLALCPNHTAMFKYANAQKADMVDLIATAAGLEVDIVLAGSETTVQFTETHLADIKACLGAEEAQAVGETSGHLTTTNLPLGPFAGDCKTRTEIRDGRVFKVIHIPKKGGPGA
jgi:hypothetical protein